MLFEIQLILKDNFFLFRKMLQLMFDVYRFLVLHILTVKRKILRLFFSPPHTLFHTWKGEKEGESIEDFVQCNCLLVPADDNTAHAQVYIGKQNIIQLLQTASKLSKLMPNN